MKSFIFLPDHPMMVPMKLKLLFLILLSSSVFAQSMDAHHFNFSDTLETVGMEDAMGSSSERIKNQNPFLFRASFDYAHDSLSTAQASNNSLSVIDHMYSVTMGASTVLYSRVLLGITTSLHHVHLSNAYVSGQFDQTAWKLGDLLFHAKFRFSNADSKIHLAFQPFLEIPTGSAQYIVSDDSYRFGGKFLFDTSIQKWKLYAHTGVSYASNATFLSLNEKTLLDLGMGAFYSINSTFGFNAEWLQSISLQEMQGGQNPTQINLGVRYDTGGTKVFLGGGVQGFDFSNGNRPFVLYAGIKQPFGAKHIAPTSTPTQTTPVLQPKSDPELTQAVDQLQAVVIYFDNNHSKIKPQHHDMLNQVATSMKQYHEKIQYLVLRGYTDPRGEESYNKHLSQLRAQSVKNYLIAHGVDEHSILIDGYGESNLRTMEEKNYATNRRVELQIILQTQ